MKSHIYVVYKVQASELKNLVDCHMEVPNTMGRTPKYSLQLIQRLKNLYQAGLTFEDLHQLTFIGFPYLKRMVYSCKDRIKVGKSDIKLDERRIQELLLLRSKEKQIRVLDEIESKIKAKARVLERRTQRVLDRYRMELLKKHGIGNRN